jgi:sulfite reductase alpha subunit-like flavoprotein
MGADVDAALHAIVKKQDGMSATEATDYVAQLKWDKRYLHDVF